MMPRQIRTVLIIPALLLALTIFSSRTSLEAQVAWPPDYETPQLYKGEKISVDFKDTDLRAIINIIAEVSAKKIIVSGGVDISDKKVTLKLRDAPWDQVLDMALAVKNLGLDESDEALTIYDMRTLLKIQADRKRLADEMAANEQHPTQLTKKVFTPKLAPIGQVHDGLKKLKSERGKIVAIGNDIYVEDERRVIAAMSQEFMRLDKARRQILIEAEFIEVEPSLTNALNLKWKAGEAESSAITATLAYDFIDQGKGQILNANLVDYKGDKTRRLSAPRILVANGQKASIKQGNQIPYISGQSASSPSPTFNKEVLELEVTPHMEEDSQRVTLDFKVISYSPEAADPNEAATKLMIKDGETIVIGGFIMEGNQGSENGLAAGREMSLSDWLLKERPNKDTELLIFLTATIIPVNT